MAICLDTLPVLCKLLRRRLRVGTYVWIEAGFWGANELLPAFHRPGCYLLSSCSPVSTGQLGSSFARVIGSIEPSSKEDFCCDAGSSKCAGFEGSRDTRTYVRSSGRGRAYETASVFD